MDRWTRIAVKGTARSTLPRWNALTRSSRYSRIVRKDLKTEWPRAETRTDWVFMGFDEDLNQAMKIAVEQTVNWLSTQTIVPMTAKKPTR